jgi:DNA-binding SARP family transcriptional activator
MSEMRFEVCAACELLTRALANSGQRQEAVRAIRRWLELDPAAEVAHRRLMAIYALSGRRRAALRQYENRVRAVEDELGVSPSEPTRDLFP